MDPHVILIFTIVQPLAWSRTKWQCFSSDLALPMFGYDRNLVWTTRVLNQTCFGAVQNMTLQLLRRADVYQDRRSNAPPQIRLSRDGLVTVYPVAITNSLQHKVISNYFDFLLTLFCIHLRLMSTAKGYVWPAKGHAHASFSFSDKEPNQSCCLYMKLW